LRTLYRIIMVRRSGEERWSMIGGRESREGE
jgi:hypothetical protein